MFTVNWIQNGAACSKSTHNKQEAREIADAARRYYEYVSTEWSGDIV